MATMNRNPLINPPRFPSPLVYRSDSPSPKRSPTRHSRNFSKSGDPLLRNLSPTSTLRAFTADIGDADGKSEDQLTRSMEAASSSERALGARIAQTCKDIRAWHTEVEQWQWPGTFDPPSEAQQPVQARRMLEQHSLPEDATGLLDRQEGAQLVQFWGCLPGFVIVMYENRIEEIKDALEELDVDSLKNHVLGAHVQSNSSSLSNFDGIAQRDYLSPKLLHLDDFTALITATILQALPHLSRLNKLLNSWSVRLMVLRKVPGYTRELQHAHVEIEAGWSDMTKHMDFQNTSDQIDLPQLWEEFGSIRDALERKILKLGARLDSMLDDLEGRDDTLPDGWIDAFESLETAYGEWVIQTERELTGQNLHLMRQAQVILSQKSRDSAFVNGAKVAKEDEHENFAQSAVKLLPVLGVNTANEARNDHLRVNSQHPALTRATNEDTPAPDVHFSAPLELAESPVLGNGRMPEFGDRGEDTPSDTDDDEPVASKKNTKDNDEQLQPTAETPPSRTPSIQADRLLTTKSPFRSRHVPIFIDYADIRATSAPEVVTDDLERVSMSGRQISLSPNQSPLADASNKVRARAAFLNGGVEKSQSLQKTTSPPIVRPFEHASQAFTKLFQRSNTALHSRSNSTSSRTSVRKGLGLGIKPDAERTHHQSNPSVSSNRSFHTSDHTAPLDPADFSEIGELSAQKSPGPDVLTTTELPPHPDLNEKPVSDYDAYVTPETQYGFEPSTRESKSTIESAWTSPALSEFPDNWPLPMGMNEEEISSPRKPINSTSFEKMFVDSLPSTPNVVTSSHNYEENPFESMMSFGTRSGTKESPINDLKLATSPYRLESNGSSSATSRPGSRPGHMRLGSNSSMQRWVGPVSEGTTPGSLRSDLSTPSVHDASAAGYFKSQQMETPPPVSRTSSVGTARLQKSSPHQVSPLESDAQTSPKLVKSVVSDDLHLETRDLGHPGSGDKTAVNMSERTPLLKRESRASVASIDHFPRSQLKTIEIPSVSRASSYSAGPSPISPVDSSSPTSPFHGPPSPELQPSRPRAVSDLLTPELPLTANRNFAADDSSGSRVPPLNLTMPKRRNMPDLALGSSPSSINSTTANTPGSRTTPVKKMHKRSESTAEQLDRHVSRVLSNLPARIRFTPISSSLNVEGAGTPDPSSGSKGRPALAQKPSKPGLTLAAAHTDLASNKKPSANDTGVKLYHLTQEGKEQPIKLYVRLVGENERVMVRVGGGWADLGEYLRQYADHHGRRTVSDGKFEIQGVTANNGGSMKVGPGHKLRTPIGRPGSVMDRPNSALSQRRSSAGLSQTPNDSSSSAFSSPNPNSAMTPTPSNSSGSRPATADDASPASWAGAEVSLAGPVTKKGLDERKARWVEDMIGRAKQASTEKKKSEEKSWGDVGRIGGTRRIIFKHQKPEAGKGQY